MCPNQPSPPLPAVELSSAFSHSQRRFTLPTSPQLSLPHWQSYYSWLEEKSRRIWGEPPQTWHTEIQRHFRITTGNSWDELFLLSLAQSSAITPEADGTKPGPRTEGPDGEVSSYQRPAIILIREVRWIFVVYFIYIEYIHGRDCPTGARESCLVNVSLA